MTPTRRTVLRCLGLAGACTGARAERFRPDSLAGRVFDAINDARLRAGVPALDWDESLAIEARHHSERMATAGFFSHDDPIRGDLVPRLNADGIQWRQCAENIVLFDPGDEDPVAVALRSWLHSAGHRKNLLNRVYTLSGVGIAVAARDRLCITQDFTRP